MNTPTTQNCESFACAPFGFVPDMGRPPAPFPDEMLQIMAVAMGHGLEDAVHQGDREVAAIFLRAMNALTRLRCARRGVAVDIQSAGACKA